MTTNGKIFPVLALVFSRSCAKRSSSPATSPPRTTCFDIFSPPPGDSDVISHVDRLSSNETKIAPRSVRIAVGASGRSATVCMVASRVGGSNLTLPERRSLSTSPWDLERDRAGGPLHRARRRGLHLQAVQSDFCCGRASWRRWKRSSCATARATSCAASRPSSTRRGRCSSPSPRQTSTEPSTDRRCRSRWSWSRPRRSAATWSIIFGSAIASSCSCWATSRTRAPGPH